MSAFWTLFTAHLGLGRFMDSSKSLFLLNYTSTLILKLVLNLEALKKKILKGGPLYKQMSLK